MKTNILKSILVNSSIAVVLSSSLLANEEFIVHGVSETKLNNMEVSSSKNVEEYRFNLQTALEKNGYLLSRVEQHDNNVYVDLGTISDIKIVGIKSSNKEMITRYVSTLKQNDITLTKVDRVLTLINSIPGVSATFSFQRDESSGKYTIVVSGDEIKQSGSILVDNIPTRLGKRSRVSLNQNLYSLITSGDILRLQGSHVRGDSLPNQTGYSISYQDQLEFNGGYWEITYGDNKSKTNLYSPLTGTTQNSYDGKYATISFAHPLIVKHNHESFLIGQYEHSKEDTENLGNVKLNVFRASYFNLYHGNYGDSISLGVTLSHGKNSEHYNANEEKSFNHLRVGGGYITPIGLNNKTEFRAESYAQIGSKDVFGSELFFLGSENFLRGYKPGYFVGESGFAGTFELAHSYDNSIKFVQRLTPYIFTDYGIVFNDNQNINGTSREDNQEAYSIGLGAKVYMKNNLFLETYLAKPLTDDYNNRSINPSVYVQLQYSW
mgnify:CR=1 FL=1